MVAACTVTEVAPVGDASFQSEEDEARLWKQGRELQARLDRSGLLYNDPDVLTYINHIAADLTPAGVRESIRFEINVLRQPGVAAFSLPHGAIYIHTGFLAWMENEAQLASILAHEISHVIHRHTLQDSRNMRQVAAFTSTVTVLGAPAGLAGLATAALGSIGAIAMLSGYSQTMETEAANGGLALMAGAGYDPAESVTLMDKVKGYLEQEEQINDPFSFSTRPRLEERSAIYRQLLDTDYEGRSGFKREEEFQEKIMPVFLDNAILEIARGRFSTAQHGIEKYLALEPDTPKAHFWLAELFRQRNQEGDNERAEREYRLTIKYDPDFADPHRGLALVYYRQGLAAMATKEFEDYLRLAPEAKDKAHIEQYLGAARKSGISHEQK
jgi:predicted Zn-dependent protease